MIRVRDGGGDEARRGESLDNEHEKMGKGRFVGRVDEGKKEATPTCSLKRDVSLSAEAPRPITAATWPSQQQLQCAESI